MCVGSGNHLAPVCVQDYLADKLVAACVRGGKRIVARERGSGIAAGEVHSTVISAAIAVRDRGGEVEGTSCGTGSRCCKGECQCTGGDTACIVIGVICLLRKFLLKRVSNRIERESVGVLIAHITDLSIICVIPSERRTKN